MHHKKSFLLSSIFILALALLPNVHAQEILDRPIVIGSIEQLDKVTLNLRHEPRMETDWDAFDRAVTQITAFVVVDYDESASMTEKDHLIEALVSGRTPRQIIVLGHLIWLERTKRAFAEADAAARNSRDEAPANEHTSSRLARNMGIANEKVARDTIRRYLHDR